MSWFRNPYVYGSQMGSLTLRPGPINQANQTWDSMHDSSVNRSGVTAFMPPGVAGNTADTILNHLDTTSGSTGIFVYRVVGLSRTPFATSREIYQDYGDLADALSEMIAIEEDDEWRIDAGVYNAASFVAAQLMRLSVPAPSVFNHGPKSVVFNWSRQDNSLYVTVSADRISVLISAPERITKRVEFSAKELANPTPLLLDPSFFAPHYLSVKASTDPAVP